MDIHENWKNVNGDQTYALEWSIDHNSNVWEIGGFEGRWASQIVERYHPNLTIFEPTKWGYGKCSALFLGNDHVDVRFYGLWVMDATLPIYNPGNDGASLINPHVRSEFCEFRDVYGVLDAEIDLCLMNIEGAEYALLPYMIGMGLMNYIRLFWCQFHTFHDPTDERYVQIHEGLKRTHRLKWSYYPTAVAWERRE